VSLPRAIQRTPYDAQCDRYHCNLYLYVKIVSANKHIDNPAHQRPGAMRTGVRCGGSRALPPADEEGEFDD